jgi:hypothetical protein
VIWMLQRNNDVLTCEIRPATNSPGYEFAVASKRGPAETLRFGSPTELINGYLRCQSALRAHGWRPRVADAEVA